MLEKHPVINKLLCSLGVILLFSVLFLAVYAPVVQKGYYYVDDYFYFTPPHERTLEVFMEEGLHEGRVLESPFLYLLSTGIDSSESTKKIRLIGIFGVVLLASVAYAVFRRQRFGHDQAFLMSALIGTLPFVQIFPAWMDIIPSIYSAFLSALSALLVFNIVFKQGEAPVRKMAGTIAAVLLMAAALSINQPPAMMYWAMGVIFFLREEGFDLSEKECRGRIVRYFSIGFIAILLYYAVVVKLLPFIMGFSTRGDLISIRAVPHKLLWFIKGPIRITLNLWNSDPSYIFAALSGMVVAAGLVLGALREMKEKKRGAPVNYFIKYLLISIMLLLCYLPKMMVSEPTYYHRTLIALAPAISVLFCFGLINIVEAFDFVPGFSSGQRKTVIGISLAVLTVATSFSAHDNVERFASRYSSELMHMKRSIEAHDRSTILNASKVYVRRLWPSPFPENDRYNELKAPLHVNSEGGMIGSVVRQALYEAGVRRRLEMTLFAPDEPMPEDDNALIIDMKKLNEFIQEQDRI